MALSKIDLKQIKETVVDAVDPYFAAIQKDFNAVYERFDKADKRFDNMDQRLERIEKLMLADHKQRIEKLEGEVKELKELLAV